MLAPASSPLSIPNLLQEISVSEIYVDSQRLQSNISQEDLEVFIEQYQGKELSFPPIIVEEQSDREYRLAFGLHSFLSANICEHEKLLGIVLRAPQRQQPNTDIFKRYDWSTLDEITRAKTYQWMLDNYQYSIKQLSTILQEERSVISNQLRLLQLPETIQTKITTGILSKSHGLTLLRLPSAVLQIEFAKKIERYGLTTRELSSKIKEQTSAASQTPQKTISVHHRSSNSGHIRISFSSKKELQDLLQQLSTLCPNHRS